MHNNGNIINATEVDTEEWLEMATFSFVSFTTIKKNKRNELPTKYTINVVIKDNLKD